MAQEQGYEARVMPQAGAPLPLARPETFGAGLADTVGQIAGDMHRREIRAYQVKRAQTADQEAADFAHRFALHKQDMDDVVRKLRENPTAPDYREHVQQVEQADDAAREGLLSGITEDSVRRRAEMQLDDYRTRLGGQEGEFAQGQRIAKTVLDAREVMRLGANRVRRADTGQQWSSEVQDWREFVDGLEGLDPTKKQALAREGEQEYTAAFVNHLNDTNPAGALELIDSGAFDQFLTPEQIDQLRNGSQVEIRRTEAQAAEAVRAEKAQFRETVATVKSEIERGIDRSADLPALVAKAQEYGDTSTASDLMGLAETATFMKVWGQRSPLAREQRIAELQAIPEGKLSAAQQVELKQQLDHKSKLDEAFSADPVEWAMTNAGSGNAPPPIENWTPQELVARERWMRGATAAYGSMRPLSKAETDALQERAMAGDKGLREVLSTLSAFSGRTAMQAMRQVLPDDHYAQQLVALAPNVQRQALDGREVLKANSTITKPVDEEQAAQIQGLRTGFDLALQSVPAAQRNAILDVAESIAADALRRNGKADKAMTSAMLARALDAALGSVGSGQDKKGGLGWWGGRPYLLPDRVSPRDFEVAVGAYLQAGKGHLPVNPDGSRAELSRARPVAIGGNKFRFYIGSRVIADQDGNPFTLAVNPK